VAEVGHLLDDFFHAVELAEGRIDLDDLVGKDARQPGVVARVDQLGSPMAASMRSARWHRSAGLLAKFEILLHGHLFFFGAFVSCGVVVKNGHVNVL
jgi:hypothetical protein